VDDRLGNQSPTVRRLPPRVRHVLSRERTVELTQTRKDVLTEMAFNLGIPRLNGFKKMWKAIENGDYETAADEQLDSKWARQVGVRAMRLSKRMREGVLDVS